MVLIRLELGLPMLYPKKRAQFEYNMRQAYLTCVNRTQNTLNLRKPKLAILP